MCTYIESVIFENYLFNNFQNLVLWTAFIDEMHHLGKTFAIAQFAVFYDYIDLSRIPGQEYL